MSNDTNFIPFGKRYGFNKIVIPIQINNINAELRTELWNAYYMYIQSAVVHNKNKKIPNHSDLLKILWIHYFKKPLDDFPDELKEFGSLVRREIDYGIWFKVYEFFEFLLTKTKTRTEFEYDNFVKYINYKLKESNSGFLYSNGMFICLNNNEEIYEIEKTIKSSDLLGLSGVRKHLDTSINLLSKKPLPDYRNSIKESISMVEQISRELEPSAKTLGVALNKLVKKNIIDKTLKEGFEKLYAFTNGENGIRHAIMDEPNIDVEEAKFFLISCSAFTNYLIAKGIKHQLLNNK